MENVCLCGRATKYQCIRCETTVCVLCAPEIQNTEDEPEYKPMSKVGICATIPPEPAVALRPMMNQC